MQGFFKRAGDIILHLWRHGTLKQYSSYITKWIHFVVANKLIVLISSTLWQALGFLAELFKNGIGYSGINTSRSSLSCIINLLALILESQGISKGFFLIKTHRTMINTKHGT